jgi:hypothetical protein
VPITVKRITRGDRQKGIRVPHATLSLIGNMTPESLRNGMAISADRDQVAVNDGMWQRLSMSVWPDMIPYNYVNRAPRQELLDQVDDIYQKLLELDPENPTLWLFDRKAGEIFRDWFTPLQQKIRQTDMAESLRGHLSKFDRTFVTLALQAEVAGRITDPARKDPWASIRPSPDAQKNSCHPYRLIHQPAAEKALAGCLHQEAQANRIYSCVQSPERTGAVVLAEKILARKLKDGFSLADVYHRNWERLGSRDEAQRAIQVHVDSGWLSAEKPKTEARANYGYRFLINPKLFIKV